VTILNKKDLEFISDVVDKGNPKEELNFATFDCANNVVYATDTKRLLKFYCDLKNLGNVIAPKILTHKETLKMVCKISKGKKNTITLESGFAIVGKTKVNLQNFTDEAKVQNYKNIGTKSGANSFQCEPEKITFEVFKRGVLFNDYYLNALIKHSSGAGLKYNVYIFSQKEPLIIEALNEDNEIVFDYVIMPIIDSRGDEK
jgi:hypothetical protein